ncbi:methyltransferase domain-containing protein [Jiella sonneratiae]|uniref:Methyltransferase domain-containing protein n=1 Tax=Jiella sonneratiae TaxID=2816856 RepID=A0ABS3J042_9HYPH|nr:methyltransferase domain-containing protein [Jiella sonneratiae]MBO0903049.1 methyltransferase domain-containing protein [Jiella sonneratiae]
MSGFAASWLDLRAPADKRARDAGLLRRAAGFLAEPAGEGKVVAVDLGCGTGATLAAFAAALPDVAKACRWRLVDADPALLAVAAARAEDLGLLAETVRADLSDLAAVPLDGSRLVTASALFDLASADFVEALAERVAAFGAGLYAALSYDGSTSFSPSHPLDGIVVAGFNRHQLRPKGLGRGASLGPAAARRLGAAMTARGHAVELADSPWRLGPGDAQLSAAHVAGMASAVDELGVLDPAGIEAWRRFRLEAAGAAETVVGHLDLLALPAGSGAGAS